MKKNKKILKIIGIILGVIIVLFIVGKIVISSFSKKIENATNAETSLYFKDYEVTSEKLTTYVKGTGEITSFNIETLDVSEYAKVKENYVNDGDMVTKNQKLLKINTDGYVSNVSATMDGMFFKVDTDTGSKYLIYDTNDIGVEITVNENDVASLMKDQKATIKISALNKEVEGAVSYVSKLPVDGRFKVRIKIDYFEELRFGYGVSVKINIGEKDNVIVIPYELLEIDENNNYYVIKSEYKNDYYNYGYIEEENRTYVEIGTITNNKVEIISGLSVGDKIIDWNM